MTDSRIVIVDYQMGNLRSIQNMLRKIGVDSLISHRPEDIAKAQKLILPGVGAFDSGMKHLGGMGLKDALDQKVLADKTPILGICLGMQLFTIASEEGTEPGLGWIDAETVKFDFGDNHEKLKIPHMGWNVVTPQKQNSLFKDLNDEIRFYFVHSYHVVPKNGDGVLGKTPYGFDFVSIIRKDNIYGVQFHPEKSHRFGMNLLRNFVELPQNA